MAGCRTACLIVELCLSDTPRMLRGFVFINNDFIVLWQRATPRGRKGMEVL